MKMAKVIINEKVDIPEGIDVDVDKNQVTMKGQKGSVARKFADTRIILKNEDGAIAISCDSATKREKSRAFSYRAHLKNMFKGVTEGHMYHLKICSSHFPMNITIKDNTFIVKNFLGEKVARTLRIKEDAEVKVDGAIVTVTSSSKEIAGQVAAGIEQLCRISNRDRRVFQDGIYITDKDGKELS